MLPEDSMTRQHRVNFLCWYWLSTTTRSLRQPSWVFRSLYIVTVDIIYSFPNSFSMGNGASGKPWSAPGNRSAVRPGNRSAETVVWKSKYEAAHGCSVPYWLMNVCFEAKRWLYPCNVRAGSWDLGVKRASAEWVGVIGPSTVLKQEIACMGMFICHPLCLKHYTPTFRDWSEGVSHGVSLNKYQDSALPVWDQQYCDYCIIYMYACVVITLGDTSCIGP